MDEAPDARDDHCHEQGELVDPVGKIDGEVTGDHPRKSTGNNGFSLIPHEEGYRHQEGNEHHGSAERTNQAFLFAKRRYEQSSQTVDGGTDQRQEDDEFDQQFRLHRAGVRWKTPAPAPPGVAST